VINICREEFRESLTEKYPVKAVGTMEEKEFETASETAIRIYQFTNQEICDEYRN